MISLFVTPHAFGPYYLLSGITGYFSLDCKLLKNRTQKLCCACSPISLGYRLSVTILKKPWDTVLSSDHFYPQAKRSRFPTSGPAIRGVGDTPLTRRPRGFNTFGLREKCMCRLPSSLTVTDTFFKVLFPQCEQNTRLMSDVVLETWKERLWPGPQAASPIPRAQGEAHDSKGTTRNGEKAEPYCTHHRQGCPASWGRHEQTAAAVLWGQREMTPVASM